MAYLSGKADLADSRRAELRGDVFRERQMPEKAVEAYREALSQFAAEPLPNQHAFQIRTRLFATLQALGRTDEAFEVKLEIAEIHGLEGYFPDNITNLRTYAASLGKTAELDAWAKRVAREKATDPEFFALAGDIPAARQALFQQSDRQFLYAAKWADALYPKNRQNAVQFLRDWVRGAP